MTRADFYDWLLVHKCKVEPLGTFTTGNAVKVISPHSPSIHIWLDLPIDERPVKPFTVCDACTKLGIPIPDETNHMKGLVDHIRKQHYPDKN